MRDTNRSHPDPRELSGVWERFTKSYTGLLRKVAWPAVIAAPLAFLVFFHAQIFRNHLLDLRILEPVVAGKWLASLLLLAVLVKFRLTGIPLLRGRQATVVWLLVLLLHLQIAGPIESDFGADFNPQQNAFLTFLLPALVLAAVGLAVCWGRFSRLSRNSGSYRIAAVLLRRRLPARPRLLAGFSLAILSRPPPA